MRGIFTLPILLTSALMVVGNVQGSEKIRSRENWPDFRGPHHNGWSAAETVPLIWSENDNIIWKMLVHDRGWSTPVVWDDQIWLTTATPDGRELFALCVDYRTGIVLHDIKIFDAAEPERINSLNSYATPSPVIEAGRVYVHYGTYGTACLDTETGKILWQRRDLHCDHLQGPASSPFLHKNLLILHLEGQDVQYLIALNKENGNTVWKTSRPAELYRCIPLYRKAYTTPIIIEVDGSPQLISNGAQACFAYDPDTGEELWRVVYGTDSTISRPVAVPGLVYINTGYDADSPELWAVRPDGRGDVTGTHVVWKVKENIPNESSPVIHDHLIYLVNDRGTATCLDAASGEVVWQKNLEGKYGASPVYAAGRIYFFNKKGTATVVRAGREFERLAVNELESGFMASPVIVGDSFILRTRQHLYRIEE